MKYCTHCGTELNDEAVVCPSCGCPTDLYNANSGSNINTNSNNSGLATTAKVFMVIGCVISAFYLDYSTSMDYSNDCYIFQKDKKWRTNKYRF